MVSSASTASVLVGPEVTVIDETASPEDDTNHNVFQLTNSFRGAVLVIGNFFLGLQGFGALRFRGLGIPRFAKILEARLDLVATANNGTTHLVRIQALTHQGRRNSDWKRVAPVTSWQPDVWGTFNGLVRDSGGSTVADLSPSGDQSSVSWALQFEDLHGRDELAQEFTLAVPTEVADVQLELSQVGTPPGEVVIQIQGSHDPRGYREPDGVVYASGTVIATTLPVGSGSLTTISTGTRVLQPGTYHVVASRAGEAIDAANFVSWYQRRAFFNSPPGKHHARSAGFGYGNYPGAADVGNIPKYEDEFVWNVPTAVVGFTLGAIGIQDVIQQVVDQPGYHDGDPIGINLFSDGGQAGNPSRRFASFDHATFAPPTLTITYQRRQRFGGGGLIDQDEDAIVIAASLLFGDF